MQIYNRWHYDSYTGHFVRYTEFLCFVYQIICPGYKFPVYELSGMENKTLAVSYTGRPVCGALLYFSNRFISSHIIKANIGVFYL